MDEYSFISENGNVRQIRDLIAKEKDEQQDERLNVLEQKKQGFKYCQFSSLRAFVKDKHRYTFTSGFTGLLVVTFMKKNSGYTASLYVNGAVKDAAPFYGTDSSGTVLPFDSITTELFAWVNAGDTIQFASDNLESLEPQTYDWYVPFYRIYHTPI